MGADDDMDATTASSSVGATARAAGSHHVCARTVDAQLRCWGSAADGRLGYGNDRDIGGLPGTLPVMPVPIF